MGSWEEETKEVGKGFLGHPHVQVFSSLPKHMISTSRLSWLTPYCFQSPQRLDLHYIIFLPTPFIKFPSFSTNPAIFKTQIPPSAFNFSSIMSGGPPPTSSSSLHLLLHFIYPLLNSWYGPDGWGYWNLLSSLISHAMTLIVTNFFLFFFGLTVYQSSSLTKRNRYIWYASSRIWSDLIWLLRKSNWLGINYRTAPNCAFKSTKLNAASLDYSYWVPSRCSSWVALGQEINAKSWLM